MNDQESISWGELAELTHATQVERFGWCICEDPEQGQLAGDCPRAEKVNCNKCGDKLIIEGPGCDKCDNDLCGACCEFKGQ
jgi:hypothetical protein